MSLHIGAQSGSFQPWWTGISVTIYDWHKSAFHAELDGKALAAAQYDGDRHLLHLRIPQTAKGEVLTIESTR